MMHAPETNRQDDDNGKRSGACRLQCRSGRAEDGKGGFSAARIKQRNAALREVVATHMHQPAQSDEQHEPVVRDWMALVQELPGRRPEKVKEHSSERKPSRSHEPPCGCGQQAEKHSAGDPPEAHGYEQRDYDAEAQQRVREFPVSAGDLVDHLGKTAADDSELARNA